MGYLVFQEHIEGHYLVTNKKRQYLGKILYRGNWRCWVYSPANDSLCDDDFMWFSKSCLHEICDKLEELNKTQTGIERHLHDKYENTKKGEHNANG